MMPADCYAMRGVIIISHINILSAAIRRMHQYILQEVLMYCDFHTHTSFSSDSEASPQSQIKKAISLGMPKLCITDHEDIDYPAEYGMPFVFNYDEYYSCLSELRELYADRIDLHIGVELGLQPHLGDVLAEYTANHKFDFIIRQFFVFC